MASISEHTSKQGKTTYKVRYRLDGKATSRTLPTRRDAERFGALVDAVGPAEAEATVPQGGGPPVPQGAEETVAQAVEIFIARLESGLPSPRSRDGRPPNDETIGDYRRFLRNDIEPR